MDSVNDKMPLTPDWNKERLAKLKEIMPDIFTNEGQLNINELKKVIDPESVSETERYEFRWFGKSKAKREAFTPTDATLVFDEDRSVNSEASENIIIEGENLAALKLLSSCYRGYYDCIFIDPPYNKDKDFVYSDKWNENVEEYWKNSEYVENGLKIDSNLESDGRFHSNWLNLIYSRLLISRQLLSKSGAIFITIDDNEVYHLRKICNEVFGENNFLGKITWKHTEQSKNDEKYFSRQVNYILVYRKTEELKFFRLPRTKSDNANYSNPDNDPVGDWRSGDVRSPSFRNTLRYEITSPNGNKIQAPSNGWRWSEKEVLEKIDSGEIIFNVDQTKIIRKIYLKNQKGRVAENLWQGERFGTTRMANTEIKELFDGVAVFDTPKPSHLICQILNLFFENKELKVLDFFAGSGSTGHSVLKNNIAGSANHKFHLIQIPEATDPKSEAFKAGYKKISDITIERNKRVIENIIEEKKAETPDLFTEDNKEDALAGLGFKVFKLQKSNFPRTEFAPDPEKSEEENIELLKKYIKDKEAQMVTAFNKEELITEILIKKGYELTYTLSLKEEFKKNEIYHVTDGKKETLICLDGTLDKDTVEYFKQNPNENLIVLERALDTTKKWNLKHYMGENFVAF